MQVIRQGEPGYDDNPASAADRIIWEFAGDTFVQTPRNLCTLGKPDEKTGVAPMREMLPGVISVSAVRELRDLDVYRHRCGELTDTLLAASYTPPDKAEANTCQISERDMRAVQPEFIAALGIGSYVPTWVLRKGKIADAYKAAAGYAPHGDAYACAGPIQTPDGSWSFLRPGKPAITAGGIDESLICLFPENVSRQTGVAALDISDPSEPDTAEADILAMMEMIDLFPSQPEIGYALIGALTWAPFSALSDTGRIVLILAGETGSFKTTLAGLVISAQSTQFTGGPGIEPPVTVKMRNGQSTVYGTDHVLHPLSGMLAISDDWFADKMTPRQIGEQWSRLSSIADNTQTGSGGTRGGYRNGQGVISSSVFPRSSLLVTAEQLPDESEHASAIARTAALRITSRPDMDMLSKCQGLGREMSRAHSAMIRASLPDIQPVRAALDWGNREANSWRLGGHNRIDWTYGRIMAGLHLFTHYVHSLAGYPDPEVFLNDAAKAIRTAAESQVRRGSMRDGKDTSRNPVALFAKGFRLAVLSYGLAGEMHNGNYRPPENLPPGISPAGIGWRPTTVQLTPWIWSGVGDPVGQIKVAGKGRPPTFPVTAWITETGWTQIHEYIARDSAWSLPSEEETRELLRDAGYLAYTETRWSPIWGGKSQPVYVVNLGKFLIPNIGGDDSGDDPEPRKNDGPDGMFPRPEIPAANTADPEPGNKRAKVKPGPCRQCGSMHAAGGSGYLCPDCLSAAEAGTPEAVPGGPVRPAAARCGVLGTDGLWLPGETGPIPCELPRTLAGAYELGRSRGLSKLWIHPGLTGKLRLPRKMRESPTEGIPCKFAELPSELESFPAGLAPWVDVWNISQGRRESKCSIVFPHLESRADWADAETPEILRDAIGLFESALPSGLDYYFSPNKTMGQVASKTCRNLTPCAAVSDGTIPPVAAAYIPMLAGNAWQREMTDDERSMAGVMELDRNKAELSAMSIPLGIGEPEHVAGPVDFDKKIPGFYRLAAQPAWNVPELPPLEIVPLPDGSLWANRSECELLSELGLLPEITEAWIWVKSRRVLEPFYTAIKSALDALYSHRNSPAGSIAYSSLNQAWHSFIGNLARTDGPKSSGDKLYRPDFRYQLRSEAYARMFRNMLACFRGSGRTPIATHADAAFYAVARQDDFPPGLKYDPRRGGAWKQEGFVSMSQVKPGDVYNSFRKAQGE